MERKNDYLVVTQCPSNLNFTSFNIYFSVFSCHCSDEGYLNMNCPNRKASV